MKKHFAIFALSISLIPAIASAEAIETRAFDHQGSRYTYTVSEKNGVRTIRGEVGKAHTPYVLLVTGKRVSGTFNGNAVSFPLSSVRVRKGIVEVAVR
jgi:hypothetical protein